MNSCIYHVQRQHQRMTGSIGGSLEVCNPVSFSIDRRMLSYAIQNTLHSSPRISKPHEVQHPAPTVQVNDPLPFHIPPISRFGLPPRPVSVKDPHTLLMRMLNVFVPNQCISALRNVDGFSLCLGKTQPRPTVALSSFHPVIVICDDLADIM